MSRLIIDTPVLEGISPHCHLKPEAGAQDVRCLKNESSGKIKTGV